MKRLETIEVELEILQYNLDDLIIFICTTKSD